MCARYACGDMLRMILVCACDGVLLAGATGWLLVLLLVRMMLVVRHWSLVVL